MREIPLETWDSNGIGNTLFGLDIWAGEPAYVVMGVGGPSGSSMLASVDPALVEIAETMALESYLAHDQIGRSELRIRLLEA